MTNEELISRARRVVEMDDLERNRYGKAMAPAQSHAHLLLVQLADALEALTVAAGAAPAKPKDL
ncbi:hypothetical protein ICM05_01160 [Leucobacter sp. cx-42]|uniref:hypothetical protein n=1 Tax=unclassified Leucobacter TaxID=2621730 RepID=UPI00165D8D7B|nr:MULTISPECIES: hypothetical protein [unclassified Leucobacter]MBC9953257.1 hypothetical protein [Leucobacter sp. cx-42]